MDSSARGKTGQSVPGSTINMCTIPSSSESTVDVIGLIIVIVVVVIVILVTVFIVVVIIAVVIKKRRGKKTTVKDVAVNNIPTTVVTTNQAYGLTRHHSEGGEDYSYDYPDIVATSNVIIERNQMQAMLHATEKNQSSMTGVDETVDEFDYI